MAFKILKQKAKKEDVSNLGQEIPVNYGNLVGDNMEATNLMLVERKKLINLFHFQVCQHLNHARKHMNQIDIVSNVYIVQVQEK